MDKINSSGQIKATLNKQGFEQVNSSVCKYRGKVAVGHVTAKIEIEIPCLDFIRLPKVRLLNEEDFDLPIIAHIQNSAICYGQLRLDRYQPGASILLLIDEVKTALLRSFNDGYLNEVIEEYSMYWGQFSFEVSDCITQRGQKQQSIYVKYANNKKKEQNFHLILSEHNLEPSETVIIPQNLDEFKVWHEHQQIDNIISFNKIIDFLLEGKLIIYRAKNGWFGLSIELPKELLAIKNPSDKFLKEQLSSRATRIQLKRYIGYETSLSSITESNQINKKSFLKEKRICLVGCGTIGGFLARLLVQSGAGNKTPLYLVDNQKLSARNIGRHILNVDDVSEYKSVALKKELQRFHPDVKLVAKNLDIKEYQSFLLSLNMDLIIDATGEEIVSDFLNAQGLEQRKKGGNMPLLHVWLRDNGIAAQSFLNIGDNFACYRCLRPKLEEPWRDDPRKRVKDEAIIQRGTCGDGVYVPFSVGATAIAAGLAHNMIVNFFERRQRLGARLRTIQIDYDKSKQVKNRSPEKLALCPACGTS